MIYIGYQDYLKVKDVLEKLGELGLKGRRMKLFLRELVALLLFVIGIIMFFLSLGN